MVVVAAVSPSPTFCTDLGATKSDKALMRLALRPLLLLTQSVPGHHGIVRDSS
jgi:hypothetical protein